MRRSFNGIGLRWLHPVLVVLCGALLLSSGTAAGEPSDHMLPVESTVLPDHWNKVDASSRAEVLDLLARHTKANYEAIRTWQGTYAVHMQQQLSHEYVARVFGRKLEENNITPLLEYIDYTMCFATDVASDAIYRSKETQQMKFFKEGSGEPVEIPSALPVDERSVVAGDHYLHFSPKNVWKGGFEFLPDHPEAKNRRAAFREPREESMGHHFGDRMDPRHFFGFSPIQKFWQKMELYTRAMRGEAGEDQRQKASAILTVYEADSPEEKWYRLVQKLMSPEGEVYAITIFCSGAGFNPVSTLLAKDVDGKQVLTETRWQWKQFNGVYIPTWVGESAYESELKLTRMRECELVECEVNQPLVPYQFDYQGLGLKDGDMLLDKIEEVVYIMEDGEPNKLADFGDVYVPPPKPGQGTAVIRWILVASSIMFLLVGLVLFWKERRRAQTA